MTPHELLRLAEMRAAPLPNALTMLSSMRRWATDAQAEVGAITARLEAGRWIAEHARADLMVLRGRALSRAAFCRDEAAVWAAECIKLHSAGARLTEAEVKSLNLSDVYREISYMSRDRQFGVEGDSSAAESPAARSAAGLTLLLYKQL